MSFVPTMRQAELARRCDDELAVELRLRDAVVGGDALLLQLDVEVALAEDAARSVSAHLRAWSSSPCSIDLLTMPDMHAEVPMRPFV